MTLLRIGRVSENTDVASTKKGENTKMKWKGGFGKGMSDLPLAPDTSNRAIFVMMSYHLTAYPDFAQ